MALSQINAFSVTDETREAIVHNHADELVDCSSNGEQLITQTCEGSRNIACNK